MVRGWEGEECTQQAIKFVVLHHPWVCKRHLMQAFHQKRSWQVV